MKLELNITKTSRKCKPHPLAVLVILIAGVAWADIPANEPIITDLITQEMENIRNNEQSKNLNKIIENNASVVIPVLEKYVNNPAQSVRYRAYSLLEYAALHSSRHEERQWVVDILIKKLDDQDDENFVVDHLFAFQAVDFSDTAKNTIHNKLTASTIPNKKYVLLTGIADMKSELPFLEEIIRKTEEKFPRSDNPADLMDKEYLGFSQLAFAALCARARMGIQEDVQRCIEMAEVIPREDLKIAVMFRQLPYIRQPQVVEYLVTYLYSDKIDFGNAENPTPYAVYALNALAEMIRDFPKEKDNEGKNFETRQKQIEYNREWLKTNTWDIVR